MPDPKPPAALRPIGCAVLGLFAVMLWLALSMVSSIVIGPRERQADALSWPEAPCVIQKLSVEQHHIEGARSRNGRYRNSSTAYSPEVTFEYEVGGQTYTSNTFWFGGTLFNTREEVDEIIARYPAGTATVCYVNPKNPQDATLSRELYDEEWIGWWFFVLFALVGAAGCAGAMWVIFFPKGWQPRYLTPATFTEVIVGWVAALTWNGLFGTLFVRGLLRGLPWSNVVELLGFPLFGVLLAAGAVLKTWQYWQVRRAQTRSG